MSALLKLVIRGFGDGAKVFEDRVEIDSADLESAVGRLAEAQLKQLLPYSLHMLEIEFPDAPENERFLRFGTDPRRMVEPVMVRI
jgi:hypothetical protein